VLRRTSRWCRAAAQALAVRLPAHAADDNVVDAEVKEVKKG
jgi:hypothetical protein